jgi:hypothetical protein
VTTLNDQVVAATVQRRPPRWRHELDEQWGRARTTHTVAPASITPTPSRWSGSLRSTRRSLSTPTAHALQAADSALGQVGQERLAPVETQGRREFIERARDQPGPVQLLDHPFDFATAPRG